MKITTRQSKIKTLRSGDSKFMLTDGTVMSPRAGFEISMECPKEYKMIILQAIKYGWLNPVAHIYNKELTMDALMG